MQVTVQGRQAYAYTGGRAFDPALPCLVFVHGALHDHSVFTLLARWFAHHGFSVLAVDLPGHGRSEGPALPSVEAAGAWVLELLSAAGAERAALAGHSMGSLIALEAAAQAPERASQLLLLGTAFPMKVSEALLNTAAEAPEKAMAMVNVFSHSTQAAKPGYPGPGSWLHGGNLALMKHTQAGSSEANLFLHDFQVCDRYAGGLEAAARVRCECHVLTAERDVMTAPKQAQALVQALKARLHRIPAAGHSMMAEAPDAVLAALRQALSC
ncbi:alpha/beta hydrolase [Mitsuaria sp. WAJ17]|uniref:alpha/beta fold hydrolase n=1 Tax=Mitsuaria sp. WAJ17 TaxID=2761452 RepID=UPI0015FFF75C|nr:alpha/beta hydrolase [Mitsuaria sp. WAJ17]MBB2485883.1 alpha/beta hydrolase [Mitsuaria sp. WAJ17]